MPRNLFKDADAASVLHYETLTPAVNEIKSPNTFIKNLLFGAEETVPTEKIELSVWTGSRGVAPFVRKHSEGLMVGGYGERFDNVEPTNIRIKTVIHPHRLIRDRRPGTQVFTNRAQTSSAIQDYIAKRAQRLADLASNAEEWLCCNALRMAISYSVADQEVFTVTYPRAAANNTTASTFWDDPDPLLPEIEKDFFNAKKLISDGVGLVPTDVILGQNAAMAFLKVLKTQKIMDMLHFLAGDVTVQEQFRDDGAIFLGRFGGMRVWCYPRAVILNGTSTPLIRTNYAEFVCVTPAAENVVYYGAIDDDDAIEGGNFQTKRFAKTFKTPDPSQRFMLLHTRPLPCPRRPDSMVSMQVTAV